MNFMDIQKHSESHKTSKLKFYLEQMAVFSTLTYSGH